MRRPSLQAKWKLHPLGATTMAYRTILVELQPDGSLEVRLRGVRALAQRFDAVVIGMHVMPTPLIPASYGEAAVYLAPELIEAQREASHTIKEEIRSIF